MRKIVIKYWRIWLGLLCLLISLLYSPQLNQPSSKNQSALFSYKIKKIDAQLNSQLASFVEETKNRDPKKLWEIYTPSEITYLVYNRQKLVYWSSNSEPVELELTKENKVDGLIKLANGWYLKKSIERGSQRYVCLYLLKNKFPYQNDALKNSLNPDLNLPFNGFLFADKKKGFEVYGQDKQFICSFIPKYEVLISFQSELVFFIFGLLGICLILANLGVYLLKKFPRFWLTFPILVLVVRFIPLLNSWQMPWSELSFFQPEIYASSELFPSFGDLTINIFCIGLILWYINRIKWPYGDTMLARGISFLHFPLLLISARFVSELFRGIVENSSIPMELEYLFTLNFYSFASLAIMGVLLYYYFVLSRLCIQALQKARWRTGTIAVIWFICGLLYFFFELVLGDQLLFVALWPLIINSFLFYIAYRLNGKYTFGASVLILLVFSIFSALNLNEYNQKKEHSTRELFASQLATDKEQSTEIEYAFLSPEIENDTILRNMLELSDDQQVSEFRDFMELRYFRNYWERYEIEFFLFNTAKKAIVSYKNGKNSEYSYFEKLIENHGIPCESDSNIYYVQDNFNQFSYLIEQPILSKDSTKSGTLFCTLKSKRIPEGIGYPRILINKKAKVLNLVENYSLGRYFKGKLVSNYGEYRYPVNEIVFSEGDFPKEGFTISNNTSHYFYRQSKDDFIILSSAKLNTIGLVSTFSYVFVFFGIILLVPLIITRWSQGMRLGQMTFALKIQLILIGIVVISLGAFSVGSSAFVRNQYESHTNKLILQRMESVVTELNQKFGELDELNPGDQKNYTEYFLKKLSKVYNTDINLYDLTGELIASSRPKVYSIGLVGKKMNAEAFNENYRFSPREYVHKERIGALTYSAAYSPFINTKKNTIGYINLQHFAQQNEFESQFQNFLVAIINVFVFLTALSILGAVFITNWILQPLRLLKQRFADIKLGSKNQLIEYETNDEIGALVEDYNKKITELERFAYQLAQTEREGAWREMAKQVAHEIKNPLTPMKLSLQHLQRIYDPNDPNSKAKLDKVANSLVEQIDALANIANEFSNFAKMPQANDEETDLLPIIKNCIELFQEERTVLFSITCLDETLPIMGDRTLLIRVFNNLFKNALQASKPETVCKITIRVFQLNGFWRVEVEDNGVGIAAHEVSKIFVPNFTTKSTGTGLGLAVSKQIIESQKGKIWFDSKLGIGTVFIVELPIYKNLK